MTSTDYTFAGSKAKALEYKLLTENQMELLVSAKSIDEMYRVLQDTFVAQYLDTKLKNGITPAVEEGVRSARNTLHSIAPEPRLLHVLWMKYDYHNLKTIIKGRKAGLANETIVETCFDSGVFPREVLLKAYDESKLAALHRHLKEAADKATASQHTYEIDLIMNRYYFKSAQSIAEELHDTFTTSYVKLLLDMYNIKAALRVQNIQGLDIKDVHISGGNFSKKDLENEKAVLESLKRIGGEKIWLEAIKHYENTGSIGDIEKIMDEHMIRFLRDKSTDIFSPASLFLYFTATKNNAQTIDAIASAKRSGMPEKELRTILRRLHT